MKTLYKYVLSIRGMRCGMCEVHVEEYISKRIDNVKVIAKRNKKQATIISSHPLDKKTIDDAVKDCSYYYDGIIEEKAVQKKSFFERLFRKN